MKSNQLIATACLLLFLSSCNRAPNGSVANNQPGSQAPAAKAVASADLVKVAIEPVEIPAGGSGETKVRLTIQNGYHVNANPPTYPYLKATALDLPPAGGVSVSFIVYPDPLTKKFAFAEEALAVYEGETTLKVVLKGDRDAQKGDRHLSGKLSIQACDEQICYAPGTIDVSLPVRIR
jgi:hypothetical protein